MWSLLFKVAQLPPYWIEPTHPHFSFFSCVIFLKDEQGNDRKKRRIIHFELKLDQFRVPLRLALSGVIWKSNRSEREKRKNERNTIETAIVARRVQFSRTQFVHCVRVQVRRQIISGRCGLQIFSSTRKRNQPNVTRSHVDTDFNYGREKKKERRKQIFPSSPPPF